MEFKKFGKEERSSFPYWFEHWKAFNYTAFKLGVWKFRFLFHDILKPWQMLILKDYNEVQIRHRTRSRHHIEYLSDDRHSIDDFDILSMVIDNECSRLTKISSPMTAKEYIACKLNELKGETGSECGGDGDDSHGCQNAELLKKKYKVYTLADNTATALGLEK